VSFRDYHRRDERGVHVPDRSGSSGDKGELPSGAHDLGGDGEVNVGTELPCEIGLLGEGQRGDDGATCLRQLEGEPAGPLTGPWISTISGPLIPSAATASSAEIPARPTPAARPRSMPSGTGASNSAETATLSVNVPVCVDAWGAMAPATYIPTSM
jgi:hypothetical protein